LKDKQLTSCFLFPIDGGGVFGGEVLVGGGGVFLTGMVTDGSIEELWKACQQIYIGENMINIPQPISSHFAAVPQASQC
jgi:hypothetical protein